MRTVFAVAQSQNPQEDLIQGQLFFAADSSVQSHPAAPLRLIDQILVQDKLGL